MKKVVFLLILACLFAPVKVVADNRLTLSDVNVPQGGQTTIEIGCEFDTEYTAFELQITLPNGLSLLNDDDGYPIIEKTFDTNHIITGNLLPSNGNYKFTCRSMDNISMPTSGSLFRVIVVADGSLISGTNMNASIIASEFTRTSDSNGENLTDVNFIVHITESRTLLDETSLTPPTAEINANIRVKRKINPNEWNTICLPFAMAEEQVKVAFGNDVQLGDFDDYVLSSDKSSITVKFKTVNTIEANHPYIIKVPELVEEFTADGVDINPQDTEINKGTKRRPRSITGNYIAGTMIDDGCLQLNDGKFIYSVGETPMNAYHAYFNFDDILEGYEGGYSEGAPIYISISETLYVRGDVNGNGIVNGTDIQAVINFIIASEYDEKADINMDKRVNGTDIQEVINIIVNAE